MIATAQLIEGVVQHQVQDGQTVTDAAGRAGQVHHQRPSGNTGEPAGQHRGRYLVATGGADRGGQAGVLSVGEIPVPPEVITRSAAAVPGIAATDWRNAAATFGPSAQTCGPVTSKPLVVSHSTITGPVRSG